MVTGSPSSCTCCRSKCMIARLVCSNSSTFRTLTIFRFLLSYQPRNPDSSSARARGTPAFTKLPTALDFPAVSAEPSASW